MAAILGLAAAAPVLRAQESISDLELEKVRAVEKARIAAIQKVYHSVVAIYGMNRQGGGSGVIFHPEGYALTNYHVVAGAGVAGWGGLADTKLYKWKLIGMDPGGDLAIIKLEGPTPDHKFLHARIGDSDLVRVGDFVMAMGNPFILAEDQTPTVTLGIVSGVKRYQPGTGPGGKMLEYGNCIQIDSSINPGNSGGPLFNMQGEVIGINGRGSFEERGRVNVGLGYAISAEQCKTFIPEMLSTKTCEHGTLEAVFDRYGGNETVCTSVNLDAPIGKAGLQPGDRLLRFNGKAIRSTHEFTNEIATLPAHWPVDVVWERGGKEFSAWVRLSAITYPKPPSRQPPVRPQPAPKPDEKKEDEKGKGPGAKGQGEEKDDAKKEAPKIEPKDEPADDDVEPIEPFKRLLPEPDRAKELEAEKEKLAKLEAVLRGQQGEGKGDAHPAVKDTMRRIADAKKKIEELEGPLKPKQPAPQPRPQPQPIQIPPQGPPMEFGKFRDVKQNEVEALRVLSQYVEYLGGREAIKKAAGWRLVLEVRQGDAVTSTSTVLRAADGRRRIESQRAGEGSVIIWDGTNLTKKAGDQVSVTEGIQAQRTTFVATETALAGILSDKPMDTFKRIVLQGTDKSGGEICYRILLEDKAENRTIAWFSLLDANGDFQTRLMKIAPADDKDQPRDPMTTAGDYREVAGVKHAHAIRLVTGLEESTVVQFHVSSIEPLAEIPADAFAVPK
ncbi:MAG: trypsin-like peptidase domain-containing protein [Phycisphaeraceae bacterium]